MLKVTSKFNVTLRFALLNHQLPVVAQVKQYCLSHDQSGCLICCLATDGCVQTSCRTTTNAFVRFYVFGCKSHNSSSVMVRSITINVLAVFIYLFTYLFIGDIHTILRCNLLFQKAYFIYSINLYGINKD